MPTRSRGGRPRHAQTPAPAHCINNDSTAGRVKIAVYTADDSRLYCLRTVQEITPVQPAVRVDMSTDIGCRKQDSFACESPSHGCQRLRCVLQHLPAVFATKRLPCLPSSTLPVDPLPRQRNETWVPCANCETSAAPSRRIHTARRQAATRPRPNSKSGCACRPHTLPVRADAIGEMHR